jgi:hypothetical protein
MDLPIISDKTDLTLAEAKKEYLELLDTLKVGNWATWLVNRIEDRLTFLRTKIADIICEVSK